VIGSFPKNIIPTNPVFFKETGFLKPIKVLCLMIATSLFAKAGIYLTQAFDSPKVMLKNSPRAIGFRAQSKTLICKLD
jgi:hypothetical protein